MRTHLWLIYPAATSVMMMWLKAWVERRAARNLNTLATQLGLEFVPADRQKTKGRVVRVAGKLGGRDVQIFIERRSFGDSLAGVAAQTVIAFPFFFRLQNRNLATKTNKSIGEQEITVGDAEFDEAWFVGINQPELLRVMLLPGLRQKLMAVQRAGAVCPFTIEDGEVQYAEVAAVVAERTDLV